MKKTTIFSILTTTLFLSFSGYVQAKTFYYMHGSDLFNPKIADKRAPRYKKIVKNLERRGFDVVYERKSSANPEVHASEITQKVKLQIANGTSPSDIIVGGYSYGAIVALLASAKIDNSQVGYALISGCPENPNIAFDIDYKAVKGKVFSVFDVEDNKFGSCKDKLSSNAEVELTEREIESGYGHKVFRFKKNKWIKLWANPLVKWAKSM